LPTTLWLHGRAHTPLRGPPTQDVRTVLETDFGEAVCDVNYFHSLPGPAQERVYVCGGYGGGAAAAAAA
jgi:cephalosporin-C deacetylase-like acetyl esterase